MKSRREFAKELVKYMPDLTADWILLEGKSRTEMNRLLKVLKSTRAERSESLNEILDAIKVKNWDVLSDRLFDYLEEDIDGRKFCWRNLGKGYVRIDDYKVITGNLHGSKWTVSFRYESVLHVSSDVAEPMRLTFCILKDDDIVCEFDSNDSWAVPQVRGVTEHLTPGLEAFLKSDEKNEIFAKWYSEMNGEML